MKKHRKLFQDRKLGYKIRSFEIKVYIERAREGNRELISRFCKCMNRMFIQQ